MNYFLGVEKSTRRPVADFEEGAQGASPGRNHPIRGKTTLETGIWYHVAATYDGAFWNLYVNGQLDARLHVGQPPRADSIQHAALGMAVNSKGAPRGAFLGVLDEARIWNYARTEEEIFSTHSQQVETAPGLVARWSLDGVASETTVKDSSGNNIRGTLFNGPEWTEGYGFLPSPDPPNQASHGGRWVGSSRSSWRTSTSNAVVQDDGRRAPISVEWVDVSGPGIVLFEDVAAPNTTANFSLEGTYVLRIVC